MVYKWCVSGVFTLNGEDVQQFEICNYNKVRKFKDRYLYCSWWGRLESARMCERLSVSVVYVCPVSAVCLSVGFFIIAIDLLDTTTKGVAKEEMYSVKHTHTMYTYTPFIFS